MSKRNHSTRKMSMLAGLGLSGLVVMAAVAMPVTGASAQSIEVKFDGKNFEFKKKRGGEGLDERRPVIGTTKSDRDGEDKRPTLVAPKGDRDDTPVAVFNRVGKGQRDGEVKRKNQQIVIGKGNRADDDFEAPKKRQVIVEPKKQKKVIAEQPVIKKKIKTVAAAEPVLKKKVKVALKAEPVIAKKIEVANVETPDVVADAAPAEETPEIVTETPAEETPAEEQATTEESPAAEEAPAEAPKQTFEVGQIVTAADGNQYIVVKVNEASVSVLPLSAYAAHEEPVKKVYKKKRHKKRYYSSRSYNYGGSSCH